MNRSIVSITGLFLCISLGLCLLLGFSVAAEYLQSLALGRAEFAANQILSSNSARLQFSAADRIKQLIERWDGVAERFPDSVDAQVGLARAHLAASSIQASSGQQTSVDDRIKSLCASYELLGGALALQPENVYNLLSLADVKAQLKYPERLCKNSLHAVSQTATPKISERLSATSADELLQSVVKSAPFDTRVLYLAAIVYRTLGKNAESLALLRRVQELGPMSGPQREYAYSLVRSQRDLQLAMPEQYPEVISWYQYFQLHRPNDLEIWQRSFVSAFENAISELQQRLRESKISENEYARFVKHLALQDLSMKSNDLRERMDQILSVVYDLEGAKDWASVLSRRSTLHRIPLLKSYVASDKNPQTTMLFDWQPDDSPRTLKLNKRGASFGVFIPPNETIQMLLLESDQGGSRIDPKQLHFFISENNLRFHPYEGPLTVERFSVDGSERIVIEFPRGGIRFLKIVPELGSRIRFSAPFSRMIQAYG